MNLGAFSISLSVSDLAASKAFYEKLGFAAIGGDETQNWLIMRNADHVIGLFQGMFERNMLTFNPGWDQLGAESDEFTDVRDLQAELKSRGVPIITEVDSNGSGPGSIVIADPDGNPILIDQHR